MTTPQKRRSSPLLYPAVFLSVASLAWTTWSLVDLLGTGWIGFTVAAGSDIVWGSVIIAEARGLRIAGRPWIVAALGWATLIVVAAFLASHGIARESIAMAAAGPFLPLGAKVVWALALADMRDPAALTHDELHKLAGMERGMVFEEREHDIRMRQQRMRAELLMSEVSTDFDIEVMRQDRVRDLQRRAPLSLTAGPATEQRIEGTHEARPAIAPDPPQKPRKRQPPAAPAGPNGEVIEDVSALFGSPHAPVVYFLRNGTRVKIGTSQNLRRRVASLSLRREDVVRVEHGDQQYERSLHRRFDALRAGDTEWFELRGELVEYLGEPDPEPAEPEAQSPNEPEAQATEPTGSATPLVVASTQAAAPEPPVQLAGPEHRPFGFSAHLTAQSAQRAKAVAQVVELLAQDPGLTSGQVAEELAVSPATAKRYLREARSPKPATPQTGSQT